MAGRDRLAPLLAPRHHAIGGQHSVSGSARIAVVGARKGERLAVAAVVLALAAACGSGEDEDSGPTEATPSELSGSESGDVVPFQPRPAEPPTTVPSEEAAGPEVPECTAELVTFEVVTSAEVLGGPGIGEAPENRSVALMAQPGERCGLSGWPTLRLAATEGESDALAPEPAGQPPVRLLLTGRQRVVGIVRWHSSCAPPPDAEVHVEATLAGGGTLSAVLPDRPGCDASAPPNTGGFFMTLPAPAAPSPLTAELVELPEAAPFDGTLHVVVELRNTSGEPVSLAPCPVYRLAYGESGTVVDIHNELNCAASPDEIPAGGHVLFAAELGLPGDEVPRGFEGTVMVDVYLDEEHQAASASAALTTD